MPKGFAGASPLIWRFCFVGTHFDSLEAPSFGNPPAWQQIPQFGLTVQVPSDRYRADINACNIVRIRWVITLLN